MTPLPVLGVDVPLGPAALVLGALYLVWMINLFNFMDGIDWMTVVEVAPVCLALTIIGMSGAAPPLATVPGVQLALPSRNGVARLLQLVPL